MKQVRSKLIAVISTVTVAILLVTLGALSLVQLTAADTHHYDDAGFCTDAGCTRYEPAVAVNGVYQIENAGNLFWFAAMVNGDTANADIAAQNAAASAVLVADIDLGSREWTPMQGFAGSFDGAGHRIDNLKITAAGHTHVGLFGGTAEGSNAVIKNFILTGEIHMSGGASGTTLGSVIGNAHTSTVLGVRSYVNITVEAGSTFQHVGGLCGNADGNSASEGLLAECLYAGSFTLDGKADQIGGIAGRIGIADIRDCVNYGRLTAMEVKYVGGILGYVNYANANVDRTISVGSIVLSEGNTVQYVGMVLGRVRNHGTMTQNYYVSAGTSNGAGRVESSAETVETSTVNALDFASGKFAYELGQYEGSPWGQTLSSPKDQTPLPGSPKVNYGYINCTEQAYTNAAVTETPGAHVYDNGFCSACGVYKPAVWNADTNAYEIANAGQLYWFSALVDGRLADVEQNILANANLVQNIVVNENVLVDGALTADAANLRVWNPIGSSDAFYGGVFDGNGYTVSGLYTCGVNDDCGLIVYAGDPTGGAMAIIRNVTVQDSYFEKTDPSRGAGTLGGVCSTLYFGEITNCRFTGILKSGGASTGGIVGVVLAGSVTNCINEGTLYGLYSSDHNATGGIVGQMAGGAVRNCINQGIFVDVSDALGGGIAGMVGSVPGYGDGVIEYCISVGTGVLGGGIVGTNIGSEIQSDFTDGYVRHCYFDITLSPDIPGVHSPAADATLIDSVSGMTSAQMASGEVAYKLGAAFGQTIGTDAYPSLGGATVYYGAISCTEMGYANSPLPASVAHPYENGFCSACGVYEPAVWDADANAYEISNAGELYWFAALVNGTLAGVAQNTSANAYLTQNITVNENVIVNGALTTDTASLRMWTPIGSPFDPYCGVFDGKGYEISGLYCIGYDDVGLFGRASSVEIRNVAVVDSYFANHDEFGVSVGGICAYLYSATVTHCRFDGIVYSASSDVGGIVGCASYSTITHCINDGLVSTSSRQTIYSMGGIVAYLSDGYVANCINKGSFSNGENWPSGGIVGVAVGTVENCLNLSTGAVDGQIVYTNDPTAIFSGYPDSTGQIINCYYDSTLNPDALAVHTPAADASLIVSVSGMTSAQMASGEVAYKLGAAFGQTIGTDAYPSLGGATVYYGAISCTEMGYANNSLPESIPHTYEGGFCTACGGYEPAVWNPDTNAYEISNAGQLYWFAALVDGTLADVPQNIFANANLMQNIVVNENVLVDGALTGDAANLRVWNPIGSIDAFYNGIFDGKGYTVSGLYAAGEAPDCGLVAYAGDMSMAPTAASIRNVAVVDSYFYKGASSAAGSIGGICSGMFMGTVTNCRFDGLIVNDGATVGGIVGALMGGSVSECVNEATFTGENGGGRAFGGIVGQVVSGRVSNCLNIGSFVDANRINCGGIVYMVASVAGFGDGIVENCLNLATGQVGGGIAISNVGTQMDASYTDGYIKSCYYDEGKAITDTGVMTPSTQWSYTNYTGFSSELAARGDIAYDLGAPWGQTIGTDAHPVLGGARVYYTYVDSCLKRFSNDVGSTLPIHHYENDVCTVCGAVYLPPHSVTFVKPADWSEVYIYLWDEDGNPVGATWPGQAMTCIGTDDDGNELYSLEFPNEAANLIFNNGNGVQTVDIPLTSGAYYRLGDMVDGKYDVVVTLPHEHSYDNGFCSCGGYEPAVWNPDANAYEISNAGQLYWFAALVNGTLADGQHDNAAHAFLTQDIIVNENVIVDGALTSNADALRTWTSIGTYESPYRGVFDGNDYIISGLYIHRDWDFGLFDTAGDESGATMTTAIRNVAVTDSYFEFGQGGGEMTGIGGICTNMFAGTIANCRFDGIIRTAGIKAGGIVCYLTWGSILNCINEGVIEDRDGESSYNNFGGIAAGVVCGMVSNCVNKGTILGATGNKGGGIVGYVASVPGFGDGIVENCLNIGTGTVGGAIVGTNDGALLEDGFTAGKVINCYYDTDKFPNTPAIHTPAADASLIVSVSGVTPAQMASGEVAYKLGAAFGQTLGTDADPTLGGAQVYYTYADSCSAIYSNTQGSASPLHSYENGVCTVCGVNRIPEIIDGVFQIGTVEELYWFADLVNGFLGDLPEEVTAAVQNGYHAVLTADIVINENLLGRTDYSACRPWTPIGYTFDVPFVGSFDGQGHTISGIYAPTPDTDLSMSGYNGLFGYVDYTYDEWGIVLSELKNIHVKDSYLLGLQQNIVLGGIVAEGSVNLTNCSFEGVLEGMSVGGIIGYGYAGVVTGCTFDGTIYASVLAGGIVGNAIVDVRDCRASGTIVQTAMVYDHVMFGGIAGTVINVNYIGEAFGSIENCLSTMRFELLADSIAEVGAIAGSNDPTGLGMAIEGDYAIIRNCYYITNDPTVTGVAVIGGKNHVTDLYACTEEMLASGEIAYRLGGAWGQSIGTDALPGIGLSTVYASPIFSACNEEMVIGLTYSNNSLAPSTTAGHYFVDGVCSCGTAMGDAHIGYGLILGGEIGLQFYMDIPAAYRNDLNARIRVTAPDGSYIDLPLHDGAVAWNEGLSRATLTFYVAAKDMTAVYTAQLVTTEGVGTPQTYSVEAYAEHVFAILNTAESEEVFVTYYPYANILEAMLRYGYHAQTYFEQDLENLTDLVESELRETTIPNQYAAVISGEMAADVPLSYIGSTLLLESTTVFRHYFTLTASAADYDMTQADFDSYLFGEYGIRPSAENPGLYCYESAPVAPTALGEKQTLYVGRYSLKIEYCPLSYAYAAVNSETASQELKNVCLALFEYYESVCYWLEMPATAA